MRIFRLVAFAAPLPLFVASCGEPDNDVLAEAERNAAREASLDGRIQCALDGADVFAQNCETERLVGEDGVTLVIRRPDSGFRRFNVLTDGRGLEAADGAEPAELELMDDERILVTVGSDRYILPARVQASEGVADPAPE